MGYPRQSKITSNVMDIYFYIFIDRCKPETPDVSLFESKLK